MRPRGSAQDLERRRRLAMELLDSGMSFRVVARRVNAAPSSVVRWRRAYLGRGRRGIAPVIPLSRQPWLSELQKERFLLLLGSSPSWRAAML